MRILRSISFFCFFLFVLLCETTCAGGYVLTGTVTHSSFSKKGLIQAYQKSVRYQAALRGLYNWFPEKKRFPKTNEEMVIYGKAQRTMRDYEAAGFLFGLSANSFVPAYEWNGEVNMLKEDAIVPIPAKAVFASNDSVARFDSIICGNAVIALQDIIAGYTMIDKPPYCFAVCSLPERDYTVYITARQEFKPMGKPEDRTTGPGPRNSLLDLVTLKSQVFQILDSENNLVAEYRNSRTTVYDNAPKRRQRPVARLRGNAASDCNHCQSFCRDIGKQLQMTLAILRTRRSCVQ
jgi:hypothetical protein